jgi:hypothetical protein
VAQFVIEFGAPHAHAVAGAISDCLSPPLTITVDDKTAEMSYVSTDRPLERVIADLEAGTAYSAIIRNTDERIRYALVASPRFNNSSLSMWMGTIEVSSEDWKFVWDRILEHPDLRFICVGDEEGVELRDEQISVDAFPWTEWPLLIGAVRSAGPGEWTIRRRGQ